MEKVTYESLKELFAPVYFQWNRDKYGKEKWFRDNDQDDLNENFHQYIIYGCNKDIQSQLEGLGLEHITQKGGGEGGAEDCYTVIKYKDEYYKLTYWYRSHHGFDGLEDSDFVKVTPRETVVTVYD